MIELYKRYILTNEAGTIGYIGIAQIQNFIARQYLQSDDWRKLNPETSLQTLPRLPLDWPFVWVINEGEYRGTFPKRARSYYHKAHGLKCPDSFLTELGNIARRFSESAWAYHFEFVNRFDWQDGDFGDGGSCYWADRRGAREMLENNGAWAIRFYDDVGGGFARAWVVEVQESLYIVFNGYGFHSDPTFIIARVIAQFLGLTFRKIDLNNNGTYTGTLYINASGSGYIIGNPETMANIHRYDFRWDDMYCESCYSCNDPVDEYDVYIGADGNAYCEHCYYELFDSCERCGETHWRENITYTGDSRLLCHDCLEASDYEECARCYEMFHVEDMHNHKGQWYCERHTP